GVCRTMTWLVVLPSVWPPPLPATKLAVPPVLRKRLDAVSTTQPPLPAVVVAGDCPAVRTRAPLVSRDEALPAPWKLRDPPAREMPATSLSRLTLFVAVLSRVRVAPVFTVTAPAPVVVLLTVTVGVVPVRAAPLAVRSGTLAPARAFW